MRWGIVSIVLLAGCAQRASVAIPPVSDPRDADAQIVDDERGAIRATRWSHRFDRHAVVVAFEAASPAFHACFPSEVDSGDVHIVVSWDPAGTATLVSVDHACEDDGADACIAHAVQTMRIPAFEGPEIRVGRSIHSGRTVDHSEDAALKRAVAALDLSACAIEGVAGTGYAHLGIDPEGKVVSACAKLPSTESRQGGMSTCVSAAIVAAHLTTSARECTTFVDAAYRLPEPTFAQLHAKKVEQPRSE